MRISDLVGRVVGISHREFPGRLMSCEVIGVDPDMRAIALARKDLDENDERHAQPFWTTFENISEIRFDVIPRADGAPKA